MLKILRKILTAIGSFIWDMIMVLMFAMAFFVVVGGLILGSLVPPWLVFQLFGENNNSSIVGFLATISMMLYIVAVFVAIARIQQWYSNRQTAVS